VLAVLDTANPFVPVSYIIGALNLVDRPSYLSHISKYTFIQPGSGAFYYSTFLNHPPLQMPTSGHPISGHPISEHPMSVNI
jgi:hypothetical protein